MAETNTYSRLEIQRYLQHKMSRQEMHDFEKALMNDPFLADAVEGFSASDNDLAEEHLHSIERLVSTDQQQAKVVPLTVQKTVWWKVASVILVVISGATITYSILSNNKSLDSKNKEISFAAPTSGPNKADSIGPADQTLKQLADNGLVKQQNRASPIIRPHANEGVASQELKQLKTETIEAQDIQEQTAHTNNSTTAVTEKNVEIEAGKKMQTGASTAKNDLLARASRTSARSPLPSIQANERSRSAVSDQTGYNTLSSPRRNVEVNIDSPDRREVNKVTANKVNNKTSLKEDQMSLSEVVVTELGRGKRNTSVTVKIDSSIAAEPVGGWKKFNQYLNHQLDSLNQQGIEPDVYEEISIEFTIDSQGKPSQVKTPGKIDKMIAEKAIQIISNGPRWNNKKKEKKVKVIISF